MIILPNKYLLHKKYKILSSMRKDKIGIFYQAVNIHTKKIVLIKEVFFKNICERENYRVITRDNNSIFEDYKREIIKKSLILKLLKNENLINFIELLQENNTMYFVSEYVENPINLTKWRKDFSEKEIVHYIKDISNALLTIHATQNIHGNIQPSNIIFYKNNFILDDFSMIKSIDASNLSLIKLANKLYAAPEQFNQNSIYGEATDIYSMGVTLVSILTGKTQDIKQRAEHKHNKLHKDIFQSYIRRLNIREDLKNIILKMLEYDYNQRYQNIKELLEDIKKLKNLYTLKIIVEPSIALIDFKEIDIEYRDNLRLEEKLYPVIISCNNYKTQKIDINLDKDKTINIILKKNNFNKLLLLLIFIIMIVVFILTFSSKTETKKDTASSVIEVRVPPPELNVYFGVESRKLLSWSNAHKFCSENNERLPGVLELKTLEGRILNQSFWSKECAKIGELLEGNCKRVDFLENGKSASMLSLKEKSFFVKCVK